MKPAQLDDDDWKPSPGDYVAICDTNDEWEGVIGVLEEVIPETSEEEERWILFVPLSTGEIKARRMVGVNDLTNFVRFELRQNNGRTRIYTKNLERVDPAEF